MIAWLFDGAANAQRRGGVGGMDPSRATRALIAPGELTRIRRARRGLRAAVLAPLLSLAVVALCGATPARADGNGTITRLAAEGTPPAGLPSSFTLEANLKEPAEGAYVSVGLEGAGTPCPSEPAEAFYRNGVEGGANPLVVHAEVPALSRGSHVLCAWLSKHDNGAEIFDSASAAFTVGDGGTVAVSFSPAPVDGLWVTINTAGTSDVAGKAFVRYEPVAPGARCPAIPESEWGTDVPMAFGGSDGAGSIAPGPYGVFDAGVPLGAGSYLFCSWLYSRAELLLASNAQIVTAGPFHGSISLPGPLTVTTAAAAWVPVGFQLDAPRRLWMTLQRSGASCPASFSQRPAGAYSPLQGGFEQIGRSEQVVPGTSNNVAPVLKPSGSFDVDVRPVVTGFFGELIPGTYRVCAWLANDELGARTDAGPVATTLTIPGAGRASGGQPPIPAIASYSWKIDARRTLRLKLTLTGKATIVVTLYRGAGRHKRKLATVAFNGHRGINKLTIRRWHGRALRPGRYTISLLTRVGHRQSRPWAFSFALR